MTNQLPEIGTPATMRVGSDSYGMAITYVSPSGKTVRARCSREDGLMYGQERTFTLRSNGRYVLQNTPMGRSGISLGIGVAVNHLDPSF